MIVKVKNKRKFFPNLHTKKFYVPETGETVILKVSALYFSLLFWFNMKSKNNNEGNNLC